MKLISTAIGVIMFATSAIAGCPASAPKINWNLQSGDQRVDSAYLEKLLTKKKVQFEGGVEHYRSGGKYRYSAGGQKYDAPAYSFYNSGVRCIGYNQPRFDLYVVNGGKLILVNANGGRFEGKVK